MRLATYQGESDLKTLVKRLFRSRGPEPEAFEKEAEAALLRANPQLRDLKELPKGVAIMVPEVRGIKPTAEVRMPGDWADKLLAEVRQEEAANQTLELLKSKEMKELAKSSPAWQERFRKIADAARARIKKAQAEKESQEKLVAQMEKDLDEVSKLFT
jgi:hypothetical protein